MIMTKEQIREKVSYFPCVRGNDYDYYCYDDAYEFFQKSIDTLTDWICELVQEELSKAPYAFLCGNGHDVEEYYKDDEEEEQ